MQGHQVWNKTLSAFKKENDERSYANEYLLDLRINWRENESSITRLTVAMVVLAVAFEVLLYNKASTTTFLFVKLSRTDIVVYALLVIVGYLYYQITINLIDSVIFASTHDAIITTLYPAIYKNDAERALHPANSLVTGPDRAFYSLGEHTIAGRVAQWTNGFRLVVIIFAPPIFAIIACFQLLARYGHTKSMLWGAVAVSGILVSVGCINMIIVFTRAD